MDLKLLLEKFLNKSATPQEVIVLMEALERQPEEDFSSILKEEWVKASESVDSTKDFDTVYRNIRERIGIEDQSGKKHGVWLSGQLLLP